MSSSAAEKDVDDVFDDLTIDDLEGFALDELARQARELIDQEAPPDPQHSAEVDPAPPFDDSRSSRNTPARAISIFVDAVERSLAPKVTRLEAKRILELVGVPREFSADEIEAGWKLQADLERRLAVVRAAYPGYFDGEQSL